MYRDRMSRLPLWAAALMFLTTGAAQALPVAAIQDEAFFTTFIDTGSVGAVPSPYAPTADQNPIGQVATFEAPGQVAFINSPPYYLVNPVAWAFAGHASADITFNVGMTSISLGVRGTTGGDVTGPLSLWPFTGNTVLAEADGVVVALDAMGHAIAGSERSIQNVNLKSDDLLEIVYTEAGLGEAIWGLSFSQNAYADNAAIFVGGLGVTPVPEPGTGLLVISGLAALGLRRRAG
ncbi:MAG: PEP-CTERM sorting domain-containing protein [Proteobacteria bacterium]|nr:PEP-CTERM sorting domain-containing protein [Pseudomonadota bacterium]